MCYLTVGTQRKMYPWAENSDGEAKPTVLSLYFSRLYSEGGETKKQVVGVVAHGRHWN
jgi:hypothetical protein